ncbi:hypothetical protein A0J61_02928 [Choanephora cucurbitarum]|uniref:Uncharacterized protein n=1 Tax=Choanephora cucurbitarum TaxID=101091 RepID=A0A1C7NIT0_9FUNG|nr:hypothetical protein A0J61_02928 [Choanephora cucurbitarum]
MIQLAHQKKPMMNMMLLLPQKDDLDIQVSSLVTFAATSKTPLGVKNSNSTFNLNEWKLNDISTNDAFIKKIRQYIDHSLDDLMKRAGYCSFQEDLLKLL